MVIRDILHILESWAPKELSWKGDNIGLQVGSPNQTVKKILITLDVTEQVIAEAQKKQADLIISHHPLIFNPLKSLTPETRSGALCLLLAVNNIGLISAHTNLDFTEHGVSIVLAETLRLQHIRTLSPQKDVLKKISVFVPEEFADRVLEAMTGAGAGTIGNYDSCSFRSSGTGTFRGLRGSTPFIGRKGTVERVEEVRIETVVPVWKLSAVVKAMKAVHPYDEVAYDVYALENSLSTHGAGAIGELNRTESLDSFLDHVCSSLRARALRYAGKRSAKITTVAVCGGSGTDLLATAIAAGADAYVTADVKYHTFQDAESKIVLVDAGHFETEVPVVKHVAHHLRNEITMRGVAIPVATSSSMLNPVNYFYS